MTTTEAGRQPRGRVHLVYPHGEIISTPYAIGRELGLRLERRFQVVYHDWWELGVIKPEPGDVLIGHPHPHPDSVFRRSIHEPGWARKIMLAPYHHADLRQNAFEDWIVPHVDVFLAITGPYWIRTLPGSRCSHWAPKVIGIEHAVDRSHFAPLKETFAPVGLRRPVYIGHTGRGKGTSYLAEIAARLPEVNVGWMGRGAKPIPGVEAFGQVNFATESGRDLVRRFDFLLTVGNSDSNPTTVLESMAWGIIPICTPTCGYEGLPGVVNVPNGDADAAAKVVREVLGRSDEELRAMQAANWSLVNDHYNWDRFASQVIDAIEDDASPALLPESFGRRLEFVYYNLTSPYGPIAWSRPGRFVRGLPGSVYRLRKRVAALSRGGGR